MVADPVEKQRIYEYLRTQYPKIRDVYKHLSTLQPAGTVPSVGRNLLTETVMKLDENFIDYKSVKLSDIDLIAIKINTTSQVFHPIGGKPPLTPPAVNPERSMIRYQFLEFLVRIAIERQGKRIRKKGNEHYLEAI